MKQSSVESLIMLESLKRSVANALERKRRLGQYAVVWEQGKPRRLGDENPIGDRNKR